MPYKDPVKQREYNRNYQRRRYHDSPEVRARQREYRLRTRFDMSVERYDELHDEQSGVCVLSAVNHAPQGVGLPWTTITKPEMFVG